MLHLHFDYLLKVFSFHGIAKSIKALLILPAVCRCGKQNFFIFTWTFTTYPKPNTIAYMIALDLKNKLEFTV